MPSLQAFLRKPGVLIRIDLGRQVSSITLEAGRGAGVEGIRAGGRVPPSGAAHLPAGLAPCSPPPGCAWLSPWSCPSGSRRKLSVGDRGCHHVATGVFSHHYLPGACGLVDTGGQGAWAIEQVGVGGAGRAQTHPGIKHLVPKAAVEFLWVGLWVATRHGGHSVIPGLLGPPRLGWRREGWERMPFLGGKVQPSRRQACVPPSPAAQGFSARGCPPRDS